jgi:hypothetical protein
LQVDDPCGPLFEPLGDLVSPPRPQVAERALRFCGRLTAARRVDDRPFVAAAGRERIAGRPLWSLLSTSRPLVDFLPLAGGDAPKSVRERAAAITEKRSRKSGGDAESVAKAAAITAISVREKVGADYQNRRRPVTPTEWDCSNGARRH